MLRTLCILCIVFLHFPLITDSLRAGQYALDRWALGTRDAFSNGLLYLALPTLAFISGYIAMSRGADLYYVEILRKKYWSLLLPMVIWNGVVLIVSFAAQSQGFVSDVRMKLADADARLLLEALLGLTRNPVNYPLHFLRDMIVLFALWPVWTWLVRRTPLLGLALVAALFLFNLDGNLVRRDTMAVTFYVGLLFGSNAAPIEFFERCRIQALISLALMCATLVWLGYGSPVGEMGHVVEICIKLLAPLVIWSAAGLLDQKPISRWLSLANVYSFPIFLMHAPILQVVFRLLPAQVASHGSAHLLAWIWASAFTVVLCAGVSIVIRRAWPRAAAVAYGGR